MKSVFAGSLLVVGAILLACALIFLRPSMATTPVTIGDSSIDAFLAKTPDELTKGLSNSSKLKDGQGMLFIMPRAAKWGFWMKDMHYSLDIVWLNTHKKVIFIVPNAMPATYPKVFSPPLPATYVIELPAGYAQKHEIKINSAAQFNL